MKKAFFLPLLFVCSFCFSQNILMKIKGMPESGNGVPVLSFSWGASNPTTIGTGSGGMSAGKVSISSFNIMKHQDATTLKMIEAIATGKHYEEITVTVMDDKGKPSFRYTMTNVFFESLQHSHSDCGNKKCEAITESVSIAVSKWKWEDLVTGKSYGFDVTTNRSL
jgi:type VI protein secretion system component Hcp